MAISAEWANNRVRPQDEPDNRNIDGIFRVGCDDQTGYQSD
jgi:hypothetical protein